MISPAVRLGQRRASRRGRFQFVTRLNGGSPAGSPPEAVRRSCARLGERARQRGGRAEQEALAELGAERARGGELLLGVDALGEHERLRRSLSEPTAPTIRAMSSGARSCRRRRSSLMTSG